MQPATDQKHVVRIGNRIVELTNLDRLLWPADGITKADLIAYYIGIAPRLLPHLKNRPLTLTRYPQGIEGHMFYQKNTPITLRIGSSHMRRNHLIRIRRSVTYWRRNRPRWPGWPTKGPLRSILGWLL